MRKARVLRNIDASDHWPVRASFDWERICGVKTEDWNSVKKVARPVVDKLKLNEKAEEICNDTIWTNFLDDNDVEDGGMESWNEMLEQSLRNHKVIVQSERPENGQQQRRRRKRWRANRLSEKALDLMRKRRKAYRKWRRQLRSSSKEQNVIDQSHVSYLKKKREANKYVSKEGTKRWEEYVAEKSKKLSPGSKETWKWLRSLRNSNVLGHSSLRNNSCLLLRNSKGQLTASDPEAIKVLGKHYRKLLSPSNVPWKEFWYEPIEYNDIGSLDPLMWNDFIWEELSDVLKDSKKGSAPKTGSFDYRVYKVSLTGLDPEHPERIPNKMAECLLNGINGIFKGEQRIPKEWHKSFLVSIPKAGDLTDPSNYRGISLIEVCLTRLSRR